MRSMKGYIIGSIVTDIILIGYLFTLLDSIGIGFFLLLSILLLAGSFLSVYFMKKNS
ncbi:hypothetical protein [Metabacillus niabensis]|uniref:hypothetical protein n=1 Tax=Metabacillus niabensis TaxID=324854 RepID=UPI0039A3E080